jgi:RsiW-degrading membrane proteinase PrsW (M82 family)
MSKSKIAKSVIKQISCFFIQTFRRHTGSEYSEFFARGLKDKNGLNRQYPWMYIRVFTLLLVLFAVNLLIVRFTQNELFSPMVMLLGSLVFNLPFLVLLYEIYPQRDLSILNLIGTMLVCGTSADVICQVLYSLFPSSNSWMAAVYAGFFEELSKGFVVIIAVIVLKTRQPFVGFLLGAAVGCGFSITEDFGYIYLLANSLQNVNLNSIINTFITRGVSAFCTHTIWTAAVGWAYVACNRRLYNVCFYLILILNCGIHICWDLPLNGVLSVLTVIGCVGIAAVEGIAMLYTTRSKIFSSNNEVDTPDYFRADEQSLNDKRPDFYMHAGHLSLAIGAFLMAVVAIIYCSIPFRETYYYQSFTNSADFVAYMQNGYNLTVNANRQFDRNGDVYSYTEEQGVILSVVQTEESYDGLSTYYYTYNVIGDDDYKVYYLVDISAEVSVNGGTIVYPKEDLYNEGKLYASFFHIRSDISGYLFDSNGKITAVVYDATFVRDYSQPQYAILFYVFGGVAGAALLAYFGCVIKARSLNKHA